MKTIITITVGLLSLFSFGQNINVSNANIFEGEPYLAISPSNSQHLVAAWMGFKIGESIVIKTNYSDDGGITWSTPTNLPHNISGNSSADVSLKYDNNGNLFLAFIDYENTTFTNGAIYVSKSTDGGLTWDTAVDAINITDCPNQLCVDRPWIDIDQNGTIFVTSMNADQGGIVSAPYNPYIAVSTDQGASFTTPIVIDGPSFLAGDQIKQPMPSPAIGADGTFYAAYPSYVPVQSPFAQIILAKSNDNAALFNYSIAYSGLGGSLDAFAKKGSLLITHPTDPNHIVLFSPLDFNGDLDIYMIETTDGTTWGSPIRINQDAASNGKMQDLVWADFNENGDLAVCWRDRRNASASGFQTETEIYGAVRYVGNSSFDPDFVISSQQVNHDAVLEGAGNDFMNVQFAGDTLYAIWGDVRTGTLNIFINKLDVSSGAANIYSVYSTENLIHIFPNPASDLITIDNFKELEKVRLYSEKGEFVKEIKNKVTSISELSNGIYYVYYDISGKTFTSKFVKY